MRSDCRKLPFTETVQVNPKVSLKKGQVYPFVDMKAVDPSWRNASESEYRVFKNGGARFMPHDTLMARITPCLENGKIARYIPRADGSGPAFGSTEFIVIRGRAGVTDNDFAYYLTKWQEFRQFAVAQMTGSSGRQRVPADSLAGFSVPVLELDKQRAIAHILGSLDDKIELNRQMNRTLEKMAQAIFKSWFINFDPVRAKTEGHDPVLPKDIADLFPDSFEDSMLGEIPKGWDMKSLDEIAEFLNGLACQKHPAVEGEPSLPVIKIRELRQGISDNTDRATPDVPEKYLVNDGDVLFSWSGSLLIDVWANGQAVLNQHVFKVTSEDHPKWFFFYWTAHHLENFQRIAADKATTMGHIKRCHLTEAKVAVPPTTVMDAATGQIAPLFDSRLENNIQLLKLSRLRDTLLPKLISGELRVPDAEKFIERTI